LAFAIILCIFVINKEKYANIYQCRLVKEIFVNELDIMVRCTLERPINNIIYKYLASLSTSWFAALPLLISMFNKLKVYK